MKQKFLPSYWINNYFLFIPILFISLFSPSVFAQSFTDVAIEAGIEFTPYNGLTYGGAAVIDYNNDGYEDIYVPGGGLMDALFRNNGDGTFTNVSIEAGLTATEGYITAGVACADIDNDGYREIFVSTTVNFSDSLNWAPNLLFKNNGDGTFTDISIESNIALDTANSGPISFGDVNNDGFIDIYVCNYMIDTPEDLFVTGYSNLYNLTSQVNNLYINNGDNTFTNMALSEGVTDSGAALGIAFFDFNNDANLDFYVANDDDAFPGNDGYTNSLFKNNYPSDFFIDINQSSGTDALNSSMGVAIGDYDENGFLDMYITYCGENTLYKNNGDETFTDVALSVGVSDPDLPVDPLMNGRKTLLYRYTPNEDFIGIDTTRFQLYLLGQDTIYWYEYFFSINVKEEVINPMPIVFREEVNGVSILYSIEDDKILDLTLAYTEVEKNTSTLICMELEDSMGFKSFYRTANGIEEAVVDSTILPSSGWGTNFIDFDHDIDLDIFIANGHASHAGPLGDNPNSFYRNEGDGLFSYYSEEAGVMNPWSARGSVLIDYDNDGDEDIFVVNFDYAEGFQMGPERPRAILYRNNLEQTGFNNWLKVKLEGTESNRDGLGAMVKAHFGFHSLIRQIDGGSSAMSHNTTIAHFGLRAFNKVDSLEIIWPGGCRQIVKEVEVNQLIKVTQNCEEVEVPTAIDNSLSNELELKVSAYPIPSNDQLTFEVDLDIPQVIKIDFYSSNGKYIKNAFKGLAYPNKPIDVDISALSIGAYIYSVHTPSYAVNYPFIVVE